MRSSALPEKQRSCARLVKKNDPVFTSSGSELAIRYPVDYGYIRRHIRRGHVG